MTKNLGRFAIGILSVGWSACVAEPIDSVETETVTSALASSPANTSHLGAYVLSPFPSKGIFESEGFAPNHHITYSYEYNGDTSHGTSFDMLVAAGSPATAGKGVYFRVKQAFPGVAVRGKVLSGGRGSERFACRSEKYEDGGYVVRLQVEVQLPSSTGWAAVGWVTYAHVEDVRLANGEYTYDTNGSNPIAVVTAQNQGKGGTCSTGPHLHMELFSYDDSYPCYTNQSPFGTTEILGRVGGPGAAGRSQCAFRKGDLNMDNVIDIRDSLLVARYSANQTPAIFSTAAADVNCDGSATITDAMLIAQYSAGTIARLPCGN